jgi:ubiquinone/menaquinone biosynthesis C-methylase UbiE
MPKTKVERVFDKYAEGYSNGSFAKPRYDTARAAMGFADDITWHFLRKYLTEDRSARILEAGAGDGYWTQKLIETGYTNITLTDISKEMLNQARKRIAKLRAEHNLTFVRSDITDMKELETNCFDFVFSQYDAVSYCMKPDKAVQELARVAREEAHVIVSLDTKYRRIPELIEALRIDEAEKLLKTNISYEFDFPQHNLTWKELSDCYARAGLEVLEVIGAPVFMHQVDKKILKQLEADPRIRKRLLEIELANCTNRSLVNFAGHLQMVGKKNTRHVYSGNRQRKRGKC